MIAIAAREVQQEHAQAQTPSLAVRFLSCSFSSAVPKFAENLAMMYNEFDFLESAQRRDVRGHGMPKILGLNKTLAKMPNCGYNFASSGG
jgi:hypothetical protein